MRSAPGVRTLGAFISCLSICLFAIWPFGPPPPYTPAMRTWVRRVRLWLGVLLLAVGVVGCVVDVLVLWSWGYPLPKYLQRRSQGGLSTVCSHDHFVAVGYVGGLLGIVAEYYLPPEDRAKPAAATWTNRTNVSWICGLGGSGRLSDFGHIRLKGWDDWVVAGFGRYRAEFSTRNATVEWPAGTRVVSEGFTIPFYLPLLLGLALCYSPLRAVIVKRRRGRRGECLACGYDRRSLAADQPCPECGGADQRAK